MSAPPLADRVRAYLAAHSTLNLATHGPAGLWCAAVLYVPEGLRLYFTSVATTRHGQNLVETRRAAGTINDDVWTFEAMKGIQLEGTVEPVDSADERLRVLTAYLARFPFAIGLWHGIEDLRKIARDPGTHGFFRLTPTRLHFMDNEHHPQGREDLEAAPKVVS